MTLALARTCLIFSDREADSMAKDTMVKVYEILHDTTHPGPMEDYTAVRRYGPEQRKQAFEFAAKATYRGEPATAVETIVPTSAARRWGLV